MRVKKQADVGYSTRIYNSLYKAVSSKYFFWFVVALFVLQAGWIAVSSFFPQAYDEFFHFNKVVFYSNHLLPFFQQQPFSSFTMGDLTRDPSYLYHYLMAIPYRFIHHFTSDVSLTVLWLRFINIAIFAGALLAFRKVLSFTRASAATINISLLALTLLPLVPYLASQLNYDSLMFLMTSLSLLATLKLVTGIKNDNKLKFVPLCQFIIFGALGSITKYSFLPILLAQTIFISVYVYKFIRKNQKGAWPLFVKSWQATSPWLRVALVGLVLLSAGLFIERYGYNTAKYHTPTPSCNRVLSIKACSYYPPWERNYELSLDPHPPISTHQINRFVKKWVQINVNGLFTIVDPWTTDLAHPVTILIYCSLLIFFIGLILLAYYRRQILYGNTAVVLFVSVSFVYLLVLGMNNYADFTRLGAPIGIQGRYLLPLLPLWIVLIAQAYAQALRGKPKSTLILAVLLVIMTLQGTGSITYILRTNNSWYRDNQIIEYVNTNLRGVFKRSILD